MGVVYMSLDKCVTKKDFIRHIANRVIVESSGKIPVNVIEELKSKMAKAEDKFKFSIYGGNPLKLVDFFSSEEWADIVEYARNINVEWLLEAILKKLIEEYKDGCLEVASKASEAMKTLGLKKTEIIEEVSLESIIKRLKFYGLKFEVKRENGAEYIVIEEPLVKIKLKVSEGKISYSICKEGKASTLDAILALTQRIREL